MMWFTSHEEMDTEVPCPGEEDLKTFKHVLYYTCLFCFSSVFTGVLQKELSRSYSEWPCGSWRLQWTALSLYYFWNGTVIPPQPQVYSTGIFLIVFALCKSYRTFFYTHKKYLHIQDVCMEFSSNVTQWFQTLAGWFTIFLFICYSIFFSYLNHRCRTPEKTLYQVWCLKTLQSQSSFCEAEDKVVPDFFFFSGPNYILLSSDIRDPIYLKTVWSCHFVSPLFEKNKNNKQKKPHN